MYGQNGRIGLVVPSTNTVNEPEFYRHLPPGVSLHSTRMRSEGSDTEALDEMTAELEHAGELLRHADIDVGVYGCTSGGFINGREFVDDIERRLGEVTSAPSIATPASVVRALDALSVDSVAVVTPYPETINELARNYLRDAGFEVTSLLRVDDDSVTGLYGVDAELAYEASLKAADTGADGVFISCTNLQTFSVLDRLETELGLPIVSSNQATLWDALSTIDADVMSVELGSLFTLSTG